LRRSAKINFDVAAAAAAAAAVTAAAVAAAVAAAAASASIRRMDVENGLRNSHTSAPLCHCLTIASQHIVSDVDLNSLWSLVLSR